MRGKGNINMWFLFLIMGLSFPTHPLAQSVGNAPTISNLTLVNRVSTYKKNIKSEPGKRFMGLEKRITPLFYRFPYATNHNFTKSVLYTKPKLYLRKEAVDALEKVQEELKLEGLSLYFFDAYRPYSVTKKMWEIVPDERYAANPAKGSGHNRGASVDVTLADLKTGEPIEMPTGFDDFSEKAHHDFSNLPAHVVINRNRLKAVMVKHGFVPLDTEWWHYSIPGAAQKYELLDLSFRQMKRAVKAGSNH